MFKRRDVLKFIAGAGVTLPFTEKNPLLNPETFAADLESHMWTKHSFLLDDGRTSFSDFVSPESYQVYQGTVEAFLVKHPEFRNDMTFWAMDEAALSWSLDGYSEGVRHGAAYEFARRQIVEGDSQ